MTTIRVSVGSAVDALQKIARETFFGPGFLNYPVWQKLEDDLWIGVEQVDATHAAWDDHRLSTVDVALCKAIEENPEKLNPLPATREALLALYKSEMEKYLEQNINPVIR